MTNDILRNRLARELAEDIKAKPESDTTPKQRAAADHILATTEPVLSTMADMHWFEDEHRLAGATTIEGLDVVMLWYDTRRDLIITDGLIYSREMLVPNGKKYELHEVGTAEPDVSRARELVEDLARDHNLHTLTDHKLAHVMNDVLDALGATIAPAVSSDGCGDDADEGADNTATTQPEVLETLEDFKNAPDGTVVTFNEGSGFPWIKSNSKWWSGDFPCTSENLKSQGKGRILRKGW